MKPPIHPKTKKLTDIAELESICRTWMRKDFAEDELKPFSMIAEAWEKGVYDGYVLTEQETILGYACFMRQDNSFLIDYLAVSAEHRGEGLGTLFLRQLADWIEGADCIVIEVEDPGAAKEEEDRILRERRLQFYLRNGCRLAGVRARVFGVDYQILEVPTGREHTREEIAEIYTELYHRVRRDPALRSQFRILKNE